MRLTPKRWQNIYIPQLLTSHVNGDCWYCIFPGFCCVIFSTGKKGLNSLNSGNHSHISSTVGWLYLSFFAVQAYFFNSSKYFLTTNIFFSNNSLSLLFSYSYFTTMLVFWNVPMIHSSTPKAFAWLNLHYNASSKCYLWQYT